MANAIPVHTARVDLKIKAADVEALPEVDQAAPVAEPVVSTKRGVVQLQSHDAVREDF
jgi:hypothetical protein